MKIKIAPSFFKSFKRLSAKYRWYWKTYYYIRNRFFKSYTTIKPRYLSYDWCDKVALIPHLMFECLSQFVEQECNSGYTEWYGEYGGKIEIDGKQVYVRDEMQSLYDWWHKDYLHYWKEGNPEDLYELPEPVSLFSQREENGEKYITYDPQFQNEEDKKLYYDGVEKIREYEIKMEAELIKNMHRLVNITNYLWT